MKEPRYIPKEDDETEDKEERAALLAAIARLPEERQQLLYLKFVSNLSNAEVGDVLERTEGAIKSLYHRTLLALRDDIEMQHTRVGVPGRAPVSNSEIKRTEGN